MVLMYDVIIIGAGAAGLMAAATAGQRGRRVLLVEHTNKIGEKIRISGGGRCNFTNLNASSANYISQNQHFSKSALANYTQHDFIKLVESHNISYHEKTLGQLFCDGPSTQIITMLIDLCQRNGVTIRKNCHVNSVSKGDTYIISTTTGDYEAESLVIATGGLSIPKIGASDFGYRVARQFGLTIVPTRPALVPLLVSRNHQTTFSHLSGVSNYSRVSYSRAKFLENILFTHKGLSGPAILQISSYLPSFDNETITLDLLPTIDLKEVLLDHKNNKQTLANFLRQYLANRFVDHLLDKPEYEMRLTDLKKETLLAVVNHLHNFKVTVSGSEGYLKAEVTAGGVDTNQLSSKTMAAKNIPTLFFIGEVVDVTGWLGGYNFQWAWSSGYAAGSYC
jgi:predicted Rossmann fold flavoprotein